MALTSRVESQLEGHRKVVLALRDQYVVKGMRGADVEFNEGVARSDNGVVIARVEFKIHIHKR